MKITKTSENYVITEFQTQAIDGISLSKFSKCVSFKIYVEKDLKKRNLSENSQNKSVKTNYDWIPNCKLKCGIEVKFVSNKKVKCECGQEILFAMTQRGRYMPIQMVGLFEYDTHYGFCPLAKKFRKKVKE